MIKRTRKGQDIRTRKGVQKNFVFYAKQSRRILQNSYTGDPPGGNLWQKGLLPNLTLSFGGAKSSF